MTQQTPLNLSARRAPRRRGALLVTAMWVLVILSAMVLVFARSMSVEQTASANRVSLLQADAIEKGAEQYVLAQVDLNRADPVSIMSAAAEALPIGDGPNGYFWIIKPDDTANSQTYSNYAFGIVDEASKINLNSLATSPTLGKAMLIKLPGMQSDQADCILDWIDSDSTSGPEGAESQYYLSLPEAYNAKNSPLESVEELLLVKGITTDLLWGYDLNRNGVLEPAEQANGGTATLFNSSGGGGRGIFPYVTVYSSESLKDSAGKARLNLNSGDPTQIQKALTTAGFQQSVVNKVMADMGTGRARQKYSSVLDWAVRNNLATQQLQPTLAKVADRLTAAIVTNSKQTKLSGLVNVNTAPREVLMCLPDLEQTDADALIAKRSSVTTTDYTWIATVLTPTKARGAGMFVTGRSSQYSADIVAVSADGRSFKRVRIVVDISGTAPAIIARKDLTSLGWPLDPEIRTQLRSGGGVTLTTTGLPTGSTMGR